MSHVFRRALPLLILAMTAAGLSACNEAKTATAPKDETRTVLVGPIHYEADQRQRTLSASIRPRIESDLAFRVAGKLARRVVDAGQKVAAGDLLALLDETDLRLQVDQAQAEASAARVALSQATAEAERGRELQRSGWTPQSTMDRLHAAEEEARGRLTRADRALELAKNGLSYAALRANADGVVTAALAEPGQVLAAGQPALRVAQLDAKEALVALPESLVGDVRSQGAMLTLWTRPDRPYRATLREISPMADPVTRTYAARFSLPDADEAVALGMSATVTLSQPGEGRIARIPLTALFDQGNGPSVWTVDGTGTLSLRPVRIARYETKEALIDQGPADGEAIVLLGVQKLDARQRVRAVERLGL